MHKERSTEELRAGSDLVIATPGRLCDLIHRGDIALTRLELLVIDEVDELMAKRSEDLGALLDCCNAEVRRLLF